MIEPPVWPLAVLGAILGATCGSLIALHAGSKSDQWAWAFIAGLILAEYLTLVGLALYSGRSIPQAIVASAFSAPIVILVGIVGLLAILVVFFGAAFAVPVTIALLCHLPTPPTVLHTGMAARSYRRHNDALRGPVGNFARGVKRVEKYRAGAREGNEISPRWALHK